MKRKGSWVRILGLLVVIAFLSACGTPGGEGTGTALSAAGSAGASAAGSAAPSGSAAASAAGGKPIKVGSKNFTEQFILAQMYMALLQANGFAVEDKTNLGATDIAQAALLNGEIDLYPEYTSTGLLTVLKLPQQSDKQQIFQTVKGEYEKRFNLTWLEPAPFNNTQALAMTKQRANELGIKTYSDLSAKAGELVLGGPPEFLEREDGLKGLQKAYGGFQFKESKQLDPGLRYQALQDGQIDVVVAFGTDGQIGGYDLQVIQDDKSFYPPYQAGPVVRQDTLQTSPKIAEALNALAPKLDDTTMAKLNWMVDGPEKMEPKAVAEKFLTDQGLLKK